MDDSVVRREEIANALTHGIGAAGSLAGGAVLVTLAAVFGSVWEVVSTLVFSTTLVLLYTASTLFHAVPHQVVRARLQIADHCAIFLLIAGTYTPVTLLGLRNPRGWSVLMVVWVFAAAGIVFKLFFTGRFQRLSTLIYLGMSWLGLLALGPLLESLQLSTLLWLLVGGISYTVGTLFYHSRRIPYAHTIWHLFVLGGSICHFAAVLTQVLPPT